MCDQTKKTYVCCHFCEKRNQCKYPCSDDLKTCKYRSDIPGDQAFQRLRQKELAEFYASQNKKKETTKSSEGKLYKISEVAKAVNQNYDFIYNKVKSGEIQGVQQSSRYFINEAEYNAIIKRYKV